MGITYPGSPDNFVVPSEPETTPTSEAGSGTRNVVESIRDIGAAVVAVETNTPLITHDHGGGGGVTHGNKLLSANTHQSPDTDASPTALHHSLGTGANQAAAGNHTHVIPNNYVICTSITRPGSPFIGLMIYETDTNYMRIWSTVGGSTAWHIAPIFATPTCRLLQDVAQPLSHNTILEWHTEVEDNNNFYNSGASLTDVTVREPGLYHIDAAVQWNTNKIPDTCWMVVTVNGNETVLRDHKFQKGENFNPGFSQTIHTSGKFRFAANDVVRVKVDFTASIGLLGFIFSFFQLLSGQASYSKVTSRLELHYVGV